MAVDPDGEFPGGAAASREFLDLALSAYGAVGWTIDFATDEITWMTGMDLILGMPGADEGKIRSRLRELVEPWLVVAEETAVWRDFDLEQPIGAADGGTRILHFHARPLGDRRTGSLIGLVRDMTGLHRDRQALTDLADRYRLLVELSPDAICVHQDEIIRYANAAMGSILGVGSSAQLLGRRVTDFVTLDSVQRMRERIRALTTQGAATPRAQAELLRVDGTPVPVELVSVRTTWEGRPAQQVIGRDISVQKAAEATLRYQAALLQHVNNAIIATDREGVVTSWNPAAEDVYGVPADRALGRHVAELVGVPLQPEALLADGGVTEALHRRSDGAALVIRISAAEMESGYVLVCADETARRRAEQDFATVVAALEEGVVVVGPTGRIESANPAAERILGKTSTEIVGSSPMSWPVFDEAGNPLREDDYIAMSTQRTGVPENSRVLRIQRPDGRRVWLAINSRALNPQDRPPHMVVTSFTDITESRAARERLEYEATHDPLTGLANRTLVLRHLEQSRAHPMAVLFLDLDNFKLINDSLGHGAGDDVLRTIGRRLLRATRTEDLVGRLGGDEFVVVAHGEGDHDALGEFSERLLGALTEPIHVQGRQLHVNGSIGVVVSRPGDTRSGQELLRDADVAMYRAKTRGGGRYAFFGVELRERVQRHMVLEQDLRHAVQRDQLWVAYQPVVDLRTDRMVAVEGLLRWTHPAHGTVSPGEFISLAEQSDLINTIGAHMLRTATRQLAAERERRDSDLHLNANLSPRQLEDPRLQSIVQQALAAAGLPARALCLEVTENAIMQDPAAAARVLEELRELGVYLAIDDFGTGNSSLAQLRRLPLDILKIDRSFVTDLVESEELEVIVTSIVDMAHAIGVNVVAEGVETQQQLDLLRRIGCDKAQGYYLGKPTPIETLPNP
ncbi:EAL domain-containing protein [Saccharopolyspora sp. K220]|uniref:sensor domain-containing protein n=1 Tax=Saccharopolyspora soli TaxID=2926618 RepID=UPI001F59CA00|nr:EAL domain-containing protein [Saccharopolyspora soli]MCI2415815.1 EAL domain-containing protein [Saccharopolyspora soli]